MVLIVIESLNMSGCWYTYPMEGFGYDLKTHTVRGIQMSIEGTVFTAHIDHMVPCGYIVGTVILSCLSYRITH